MPLSYHGFTPTAILLMVICLSIRQGILYWKQYNKSRKIF